MFTASRLGEGGAGPHTLAPHPSPPDRDGWWGHGCSTGHRRPGTLSSVLTLLLRDSRPSRTANQCKRLIVQIEFRRDGGQTMDGLCLLSKEGGKERREKTEKRLKRRKRGGGVVVGGARLAVVSSPQLGWWQRWYGRRGWGCRRGCSQRCQADGSRSFA